VFFKPGERGADPFLALAYALKKKLGATGQTEGQLAQALRADPDEALSCFHPLLNGRSPAAELILVVDQLEELFTAVDPDGRDRFIELLKTIVNTPRVRLVATMRVDFTASVAELPDLAPFFRGRGLFLLVPPGPLGRAEGRGGPALIFSGKPGPPAGLFCIALQWIER
jgi:hypothetical protein